MNTMGWIPNSAVQKRKIRKLLNELSSLLIHLDGLDNPDDHDYQNCEVCKNTQIRPTELSRCTSTASYIAQKCRGVVTGYGAGSHQYIGDMGGGHDFALVYDRFIVDWWATVYGGNARDVPNLRGQEMLGLYDLQNDSERIIRLYGDPSTWNVSADYKDRSVENIWQTDFYL